MATGGASPSGPGAGAILRAVSWHSLALALLMGALVWLMANVFPAIIPALP